MQTNHKPRTLKALVDEFDRGIIALPLMQRDYVWRAKRVVALLESLYKGYPIGCFYLWKSQKQQRRKGLGVVPPDYYLLDGQQRLTSLQAAKSSDDQSGRAYFDIANECFFLAEQSRRISGRIKENDPTLVALYDLIAPGSDTEREERLVEIQEKLISVGKIKRIGNKHAIKIRVRLANVSKIMDREVPCEEVCFDPNDEKELDEAIEIFERLNRGGMSLKQGDVKAARLASEATASVLPRMREFMKKNDVHSLGLNFLFLTRVLATLHRGDSGFISDKKKRGERTFWSPCDREDGRTVNANWAASEKALNAVIQFIRDNLGWTTRRWLTSANALIPIAYLIKWKPKNRLTHNDIESVRNYLCIGGVRKLFHGSVETTINHYVKAVKKARSEGTSLGGEVLLNAVPKRERTLITPDEILSETRMTAPLMQVYLSYLISQDACSWLSGTLLRKVAKSVADPIAVHHIFPKQYLEDCDISTKFVNSMANYAIISQRDNESIGEEDPKSVFGGMNSEQKERAECQLFVIANYELLAAKAFEEYRQMRARKLADQLNLFLGLK